MSVTELRPFVRGAHDGEALWIVGALYTFRAVGADNGNAYSLVEVHGHNGLATPLHIHEHEEEGFYVVSGEVNLVIGGQTIKAGPGSFAFAPRGVAHAFRLESEEAKLLLLITPGACGHESLFREMGEMATERIIPPQPAELPDFAVMAEIAAKNGTRTVGPPP